MTENCFGFAKRKQDVHKADGGSCALLPEAYVLGRILYHRIKDHY